MEIYKTYKFIELENNPSFEELTLEELNLFKSEYLYELDLLEKIEKQLLNHLPSRSYRDLYACCFVLNKHYNNQLNEINEKLKKIY